MASDAHRRRHFLGRDRRCGSPQRKVRHGASIPRHAARGHLSRRVATWEDVVAIASRLPHVEESTWNGRAPSLKVAARSFARVRSEAEGGVVLMCDLAEKEALLASGNPAFFTTDHYDGHGSILVRLGLVDDDELAELVVDAWRITAPVRVRQRWEEQYGPPRTPE